MNLIVPITWQIKHTSATFDKKRLLASPITGVERFDMVKCSWLDCVAGMGLAGLGSCFSHGMWWHPSCPRHENEDEFLKRWNKESKQ